MDVSITKTTTTAQGTRQQVNSMIPLSSLTPSMAHKVLEPITLVSTPSPTRQRKKTKKTHTY